MRGRDSRFILVIGVCLTAPPTEGALQVARRIACRFVQISTAFDPRSDPPRMRRARTGHGPCRAVGGSARDRRTDINPITLMSRKTGRLHRATVGSSSARLPPRSLLCRRLRRRRADSFNLGVRFIGEAVQTQWIKQGRVDAGRGSVRSSWIRRCHRETLFEQVPTQPCGGARNQRPGDRTSTHCVF